MTEEKDFFDISELIDDYYTDSISLLDKIVDSLLTIEKAIKENSERIIDIKHLLGPLHTIKGNSGMLGFSTLQQYVHEVEGVIKSYLEKPDLSLAPSMVDFLLEAEKKIRKGIEEVKQQGNDPEFLANFIEPISKIKDNLDLLNTSSLKEPSSEEEEEITIHRETQLIKVDFSKLDRQINLLGELIIYRTRLDQIESSLLQKHAREPEIEELIQVSQAMGKKITELQEAVMALRLLPIKHVFNIIPRIVREESRKSGKEIEVSIIGEETELDKSVIDQLHEPILHIIRNAIDHGIESPEERLIKGKDRIGRIIVSAKQESNFIIITIEDDGRGIDIEEIYKVGLEKGLIETGSRPSDKDILNLIFTPGFSTSKVTTTTSGRGVGLEVVAEVISSLGGSIEVETTLDVGTRFILKIPLTLAIITALMVEASGETYAIPTSAVQESIKINSSDFRNVRGGKVILLRGNVIPVVFLHEIVDLPSLSPDEQNFYTVIVDKNDQKIGIVVEKLLGQQEIVIKSLDESITTSVIAGATILGNGKIVLILDITAIVSESQIGGKGNVYRVL